MIAAIPALWKYLGAILIVFLVVGGIYGKGRSDGKAVVQAVLDDQRAAWQGQFDRQSRKTAAQEAAWAAKTQEVENALQARLDAATVDSITLADRLREYTRRRSCPLSQAAGTASVADAATGEPADGDPVERAVASHFAACSRDAARLAAWQEWYEAARAITGGAN